MGAGALTCAAGGAFGVVDSRGVRREDRELRLPRWDVDGFRIGVLADFHLVSETALERGLAAVAVALEAKPDVIALLGDYVESSDDVALERLGTLIASLRNAPCPVVAVMGNHDYWTARPSKVLKVLNDDHTVKLLRNASVAVGGVHIGGVEDAIARKHKPEFLSKLGDSNVLALFHEPDFVTELPGTVSLQIAGHSHGGQICLPGGKALMLPRGARTYYRGFYPHAHVPLYVSRGIGTSGPDVRAFCPPEVSVLTLRPAA